MTGLSQHELQEIAVSRDLEPATYAANAEAAPRAQTVARLRLLWEQRRLLLRASIFGLVMFTAVAFLIPKRFESSAVLMPPDDQSASGMMMAAALANRISGSMGGIAGDILGIKNSGDLFIGIIRSRTVQDDVIKKLDLMKVYGTNQWEPARRRLNENTMISEDRKSGMITITVSDRSPERAARIAGEYVTELDWVVTQLSTSSAHRERVFLEERLAQVRQDLEKAERDFSEFASRNGTIDIKEQGRAMVESAATVEGQLIAAQSELQGLKQIYSENNVRVRSVKARISELQNQLQQLGGKQEIAKDATNSGADELYPSIRKLPLLGVPYADLYRRTRVQEAVFESLTQQYELAKVAEAKEVPSVKVLDQPNVPEHKSYPPRLVIMILGLLFGFASAVVLVVARARWQAIAPDAPHRILVEEIFASVNVHMPWATPNGSRFQAVAHKIWVRIAKSHSMKSNSDYGSSL